MTNRKEEFEKKSRAFHQQASAKLAVVRRVSVARVLVFMAGLSAAAYLANGRNAVGVFLTALVVVPLFGWLVNKTSRARRQQAFLDALAKINECEVRRLEGNLAGLDGGESFADETHPYAADLDIFGSFSLFQLLNRGTTGKGKHLLAERLKAAADKQSIEARQAAVQELAAMLEWRQSFEASGMVNQPQKRDGRHKPVDELLEAPLPFSTAVKAAAYGLFVSSLLITGLALLSLLSWHWVAGAVVANALFLIGLMRGLNEEYLRMGALWQGLWRMSDLLQCIEKAYFQHHLPASIRDRLFAGGRPASVQLARLLAIIRQFDNRGNFMYQMLNAVFLLDFWLMLLAHKWLRHNSRQVKDWLQAIGQMEALSSLAGFAYANPAYRFATIGSESLLLSAQGLGHPMIPPHKRVINDFGFNGRGLMLITGSNMSGKSTFLRTVGVNTVLALCGAPVCASCLTVSCLMVFTSMRTHDNLKESVSSFYAELRRIRQLLDLLETGRPVLYMLDEVLKGTNSEDRHKGAEALIRQLLRTNAVGFISTHDLTLSQLEADNGLVANYSFNSRLQGSELIFDYKLGRGPCTGFNATELMRRMGIVIG